MIDVTNQLGNHSINSITQLFGINLSNEQSNENVNGLQKKWHKIQKIIIKNNYIHKKYDILILDLTFTTVSFFIWNGVQN